MLKQRRLGAPHQVPHRICIKPKHQVNTKDRKSIVPSTAELRLGGWSNCRALQLHCLFEIRCIVRDHPRPLGFASACRGMKGAYCTALCKLLTARFTLLTAHRLLLAADCTLHTSHLTLLIPNCTLLTLHRIFHTTVCTLQCEHYSVHTVECTLQTP